MTPPSKKNNSLVLGIGVFIAIIVCGFALYVLPLQSTAFNFDDIYSVEQDPAIRHIDIPGIFNAFNTRFLVGLSFALNYKCCGLNAIGYRMVNFLIHCFNSFLVYLLVRSTLYLYSLRKLTPVCRLKWAAFFGSMLFLCHPVQTEPVNFITQRFVLMGSFFYLLTLYLYIQYRCRSKRIYLIGAMGSAVAAMFCKEFVVTLPLMLVLYDLYFLGAVAEPWWKRCSRVVPFFIIVLIVPLLLLRTPPQAVSVANIAQKVEDHIDITRAYGGISRKRYFLTELNVMRTYVRLLFLPVNQNFDYDYPISKHPDARTLLSGMFLLGLLALAGSTYKTNRMISFGILWFFIALSVESSFIPIGHVIAEYRLYLASAGFVFLVIMLINMVRADVRILNIIAVMVLVCFSVLTYERNKIWKNDLVLWDSVIQGSPHKTRGYNNRGVVYYKQGKFDLSVADFSKAIEMDPKYADAYTNRGNAYSQEGKLTEAMSDFNKAIAINPHIAKPYNGRGFVYKNWGDLPNAIADYTMAIKIDPDYAEPYSNRGGIYDYQGNFPQAIADCTMAIEKDPYDPNGYYNRGVAYFKEGDLAMAVSDYSKALEINPDFTQAYKNRASIYKSQGNLSQAASDYAEAIEKAPNDSNAYNNLGDAYFKQGNITQAISDYSKAIEIDPNSSGAYNNRGYAYSQQGNLVQALSDFNKAIGLNPRVAQEYNNRGNVYNMQNKFDQALSDYSKALEINPKYAEVYYNRGNIYDYQGNATQALSDYSKAIEINPGIAQVYISRGVLYGKQGKLSEAISDYDKAIGINPNNARAYYDRALAYDSLKEYDKAQADKLKAEELAK